ncbi:LamB/YcsF family protein [Cumulibacter manganitolerans]|uniref:LamB/YcsF family protein n=1 Tax=Cumulibacter manganitolerans TaxID=1884992 RepID=UPI00129495C4|nr:5-oxoprolinase subunit PxpA [Cumulibacter manganitolerans]
MSIDLNADLGEGLGQWAMTDDEALLRIVTSANVACGFHAGDPTQMLKVCRIAASTGAAIGAHVAYRDLIGFGRRFVDVEPPELTADVLYQLHALDGIARSAGTRVRYVKPHGALYNTIVHHEPQARAVVEALRLFGRELPVMGLPGAVWLDLAAAEGLPVVHEAFPDRAYTPEGRLAPRGTAGGKLTDAQQIADRAVRMAREHTVVALDGSVLEVAPDSLCVHGDTPTAVATASAVRRALSEASIELAAFA